VNDGQQIVLRGSTRVVRGGVGDVPFTHLPALGGGETLRSYDWGRFRDRAALAGTAEWRWKIWRNRYHGTSVHSFLFLDQGAVGAGLNELGDFRSSWGFGLGSHVRQTRVAAYVAFGAEGSRLSASIRSEGW
jgi:outer membrane protein assembly factor BamA